MNKFNSHKKLVQKEVDRIGDRLIEISDYLYRNPEFGCEEFNSSELLSSELKKHGFTVEKPYLDMTTAFKGTFKGKSDGPKVAILGEYDALEGIGHGCGHNMIGTAAIGAGIALSKVMKDLSGEVVVLGCPAEENRKGGPPGGWPCQGSKRIMCAQGTFDDIDAAIMIHPGSGLTNVGGTSNVSRYIDVIFHGKSAHAAGDPWDGANAMQAAVLFMNGVNALRQQFRRGRPYLPITHWIIQEAGTAGNVIPDYAHCYGGVRSMDHAYRQQMVDMIHNCAKGAALMTGCEVEYIPRPIPGPPRSEKPEVKISNLFLAELIYKNLVDLGVETEDWKITARKDPGGGTDFSNVTQRVPSVEVKMSISKKSLQGHSTDLAKATTAKQGHEALLNGTKTLAMTAIDIFTKPERVEKMKAVHLVDIDDYMAKKNEIGEV